jgi:predicted Zn-dependent protease
MKPRLSGSIRKAVFAIGVGAALLGFTLPVYSQSILRDTETEEMLRNYETPLGNAAGLNPVPRVWLIGDPEINAFASYGDPGENIFIFSGILLWLRKPNELIGVMAHETGHIAAGHLSRGSYGMKKAMIPMLLSMAVAIAALAAGVRGAGSAFPVLTSLGEAVSEAQMAAFTRVQESTADQIATKLLLATHQSPMGMYETFERFAADDAKGAYKVDKFAVDHPTGQDRVFDLNDAVEASPYREIQDSPESLHTFQMVQAKLGGYILPVKEGFNRFPESDSSEPARYAHTMLYMRQPNFQKALATATGLIKEEPENPYFYEVRGQISLSMAKPQLAIADYQKAVTLRPQAPQLRLELATAQLAAEDPALANDALNNLKAAILVENDDPYTWYETAQAYSMLKNEPMEDLCTAELWYSVGDMGKAVFFAARARGKLPQGSAD